MKKTCEVVREVCDLCERFEDPLGQCVICKAAMCIGCRTLTPWDINDFHLAKYFNSRICNACADTKRFKEIIDRFIGVSEDYHRESDRLWRELIKVKP